MQNPLAQQSLIFSTPIVDEFGHSVRIPDFWQAEAVKALAEGKDVVLHAPTGAGKTYVFERFFTSGFRGNAVYTVPTRALANDKYREWRALGWNVGISTGDYASNTDAPLVVATLETQKTRILAGETPGLFAIDEYQLVGDPQRGANYEIAIAMMPKATQLLLLSGSVSNRGDVLAWLRRLGRDAVLVEHEQRPVPLEEIYSENLLKSGAFFTRGLWPELVKKVMEADMAPLLVFAPRRSDAENIAHAIAREFDGDFPLKIETEKLSRAGRKLAHLLKRRVAFHHSGLTAFQRASLVEDLAKSGDLKVVVATTGLGAGVNFSMRSVIVADREYDSLGEARTLRPDELLQMYGRAGRRGLDSIGYAICLPSKPRLSDARETALSRGKRLDWPAILHVMDIAAGRGKDPRRSAQDLCDRLFTSERIEPGFSNAEKFLQEGKAGDKATRIEMLNSNGIWERRKAMHEAPLSNALFFDGKAWGPFLQNIKAVASLKRGAPVMLGNESFGISVHVASVIENGLLRLNKSIAARLKPVLDPRSRILVNKGGFSVRAFKRHFPDYCQRLFWSGSFAGYESRGGNVFVFLNISNARVRTMKDENGAYLYNPPCRENRIENANDFEVLGGFKNPIVRSSSPAEFWLRLGLVDENFNPSARGKIFSRFNGGEGLAIAVALEDESYKIEEIYYDIANLRAGKRFELSSKVRSTSSRLGDICRLKFSLADIPGYLARGIPTDYGEGAAEIVRKIEDGKSHIELEDEVLRRGDIERAWLEWRSLVRHIAYAADCENVRFMELKRFCFGRL